jgi:hypothetical protein
VGHYTEGERVTVDLELAVLLGTSVASVALMAGVELGRVLQQRDSAYEQLKIKAKDSETEKTTDSL